MSQGDSFKWNVHATVKKWESNEDFKDGKEPQEVVEADGNILLNEGINRLLNLLAGAGGTPFDNANARLGVGSGDAAADPAQTDLQGNEVFWSNMDGGFPTISNQTITFRATFGDDEANFAWREWSISNGPGSDNLNRRVVDLGTKNAGTWSLEVDINVS